MTPVLLFLSYISDLNTSLGNSGSSKCSNNSQITFSTFCLSDQSPSNVKLEIIIGSLHDRNKAKGTLVPERGWKYQILPTKVHPQTSSPKFIPRIQPQLSSGSRYLLQGIQPDSKPRCLAWAEKRMLQKTCQKVLPLPPSPLLLTTRSAELKLSALKNVWIIFLWF